MQDACAASDREAALDAHVEVGAVSRRQADAVRLGNDVGWAARPAYFGARSVQKLTQQVRDAPRQLGRRDSQAGLGGLVAVTARVEDESSPEQMSARHRFERERCVVGNASEPRDVATFSRAQAVTPERQEESTAAIAARATSIATLQLDAHESRSGYRVHAACKALRRRRRIRVEGEVGFERFDAHRQAP